MKRTANISLAMLTGLALLALSAPAVFAHGPDARGEVEASPGGNAPYVPQAPGQMMGGGMMGSGMMGGGMMGGQNGYGGMMGGTPPVAVPTCPGTGASPSAPCGNQGFGGMTAPQGQMLPMTR